MKRLLTLLCAFIALSSATFAQRVAVVDFNAGVGISQHDVDGISAIFNTYFSPAGYTLVERTAIDRVIDEQNFQRGKITEQQMVKLGRILNVTKIVIGDVNVVQGEYNIDVRVVNVETGTVAAKEGATWSRNSTYRDLMRGVATRLADQIAIRPKPAPAPPKVTNTPPKSVSQPATRSSVMVVYGYLKVFPNELGTFPAEPTTVIAQINKQGMYNYETWRLPLEEELALLKANNLLGSGKYMSKTRASSEGIVLLVTDESGTVSDKYDGKGRNGVYEPGYFYDVNGVKGVVFEVSVDGKHGKIVSLNEGELTWGLSGTRVGAGNKEDGRVNEKKVKDGGYFDRLPAFVWCEQNGEDWYLPAVNELEVLYGVKTVVNSTLEAKGYVPISNAWHLSSSESDFQPTIDAYGRNFSNGAISRGIDKHSSCCVRAVLAF